MKKLQSFSDLDSKNMRDKLNSLLSVWNMADNIVKRANAVKMGEEQSAAAADSEERKALKEWSKGVNDLRAIGGFGRELVEPLSSLVTNSFNSALQKQKAINEWNRFFSNSRSRIIPPDVLGREGLPQSNAEEWAGPGGIGYTHSLQENLIEPEPVTHIADIPAEEPVESIPRQPESNVPFNPPIRSNQPAAAEKGTFWSTLYRILPYLLMGGGLGLVLGSSGEKPKTSNILSGLLLGSLLGGGAGYLLTDSKSRRK